MECLPAIAYAYSPRSTKSQPLFVALDNDSLKPLAMSAPKHDTDVIEG